jgi:hypothetical protein
LVWVINLKKWRYYLRKDFISAYFASKANAMMPAARGAEAEVPVCIFVQPVGTSTVT